MCESRILKMLKDVKTGRNKNRTLCKRYEDFMGFDLMSIRLTKDQGNMWLFLTPLTLETLEMWWWCINTNHKMNAWNKGPWVPTTEQPHNKWGHRKNYIIFGVAFDGWLFIREACQEFKGCLRFKDFLQLMRLILDFQVMRHAKSVGVLYVEVIPRDTSLLFDSEWDSACCVVER